MNIICAGGIVTKNIHGQEYILLVIKKDGLLTFPKGHVEAGEKIEEAAVREVEEETGLQDIQLGQKLGVVARHSLELSGEEVMKDIHLYAMTSDSENHKVADEKYGWFTMSNAMERLKFEEEKKFLSRVIKYE